MKKVKYKIAFFTLISILIFLIKIRTNSMYRYGYNMLTGSSNSINYYKINVLLDIMYTILGIVVPIILMFSGISIRIRNFSYKIKRKWLPGICIYSFFIVVIYYLMFLPIDFYSGFINEHAFAMSNQSLVRWFYDWGTNILISAAVVSVVLWIPYILIKKSPKRWWLYTWLLSVPLVIFVMIISPIVIDPLYNKFEPLKDKNLEYKIESLTEKAGISNCKIYEVDKSKDTQAINAYMTGIGNTKRIVIWDTTIKNLPEDQIEFIVAHEIGHYVLNHVFIGTIETIASFILLFYLIYRTAPLIIKKYGKKLKIDSISNIVSFPLIILIMTICIDVAEPVSNGISRAFEHAADTFAVELTHDNDAGVKMFEKIAATNLSVMQPDEWYEFWKYDHPSLKERIDFINSYRPWEVNEPLKYERYIKK